MQRLQENKELWEGIPDKFCLKTTFMYCARKSEAFIKLFAKENIFADAIVSQDIRR